MKKLLLIMVGCLLYGVSFAQGYDISIKINGLACDEDLLLANYFGDKQYLRDTSECYRGQHVFKGKDALETGIYLVVLPNRKYFEIVISDDEDQMKYSFETDTLLDPAKMIVKGSWENQVFYQFNKFAAEQGVLAGAIRTQIDSAKTDKEKEKLREKLSQLGRDVSLKRREIAATNSELFIGKVYKAMQDVEVPTAKPGMSDSAKNVYTYLYTRDHFWDNIDNGEDGLVRTPIFHTKLKEYFGSYVPPIPDTSIMLADELINRMEAEGSKDQFKYTIHFLLDYYQKSKYMCFDKALYHITKNYYCNGRAFWADSSFRAEMCEQSAKMAPSLCDLVAPNLSMPDSTFSKRVVMHDIQKPVTVLVFWDIDCGHCKKEMPILKAYYDSCNKQEVEIYAVYTQGNWQGWKDYVRKNELKFINVANAFGEDDFRDDYNIISTPQIYVLDREKKIRFKKIAAKDVSKIVDHLLEEQASDSNP